MNQTNHYRSLHYANHQPTRYSNHTTRSEPINQRYHRTTGTASHLPTHCPVSQYPIHTGMNKMNKPYPPRRPNGTKELAQDLNPTHVAITTAYLNYPPSETTADTSQPPSQPYTADEDAQLVKLGKRHPEASPEKPKHRTSSKKLVISTSPEQAQALLTDLDDSPTFTPFYRHGEKMSGTPPSPTPAVRDPPPHIPMRTPVPQQPVQSVQRPTPADDDVDMNQGRTPEQQRDEPVQERPTNHQQVANPQPVVVARNAQVEDAHPPPPGLPPNVVVPDYTVPPAMGFPTIHLGTLPNYFMDEHTMKDFDSRPEPKFWARMWMGVHDEERSILDINAIRRHIYYKTGEKALVIPPMRRDEIVKATGRMKRFHPPYHYLVTGLSQDAAQRCLDRGVPVA
ncbi:hypothetical protein H0H92_005545 [Tricholoma furcatifolium]|nr:hypothetical protein H0H92_005545 [Tricholoma furcatifolium]